MIRQEKKKTAPHLSKTLLCAIILALVLILCIGGYHLAKKIQAPDDGNGGGGSTSTAKLLYPSFSFTGNMDTFTLTVYPDNPEETSYQIYKKHGEYVYRLLIRNEATGLYEEFLPDITSADPYFTYTDLYATDSLGYAEVWRLYYLSAGIGSVYYNDVIENVPTSHLKLYGLDDDSATKYTVKFKETQTSEEREFSVLIGDATPGGKGYYVCMDDDKTKVYPTESNTLSYVEQPFSYYIKPRLVASGLTSSSTSGAFNDSSYEPYLTSDFKEWKNTVVSYKTGETNTVPSSFSDLVLTLQMTSDTTGYKQSAAIDASILSFSDALAQKIKAQTVGKELGELTFSVTDIDKTAAGTIYTLTDPNVDISYTITKIHAVVKDTTDVTFGVVGNDAADLIVTYQKSGETYHGCLDLSAVAQADNAAEIAAIRAAQIGEDVSLPLTVHYSETAAAHNHYRTYVKTVTGVTDAVGNTVTTAATSDSTVYFVYVIEVDGETLSYNTSVSLANDSISNIERFREILVGVKAGETPTDNVIEDFTMYSERIYHYTNLAVQAVKRYVTREQIAGFAFVNADVRDPFYGETYYKNTLEGNPYGVNSSVCEDIARQLGGLEGDSSTSAGLYGTETVAVGLTPDVMAEYGLYAYTVYYELPRGIYMDYAEDGETVLYHSTYTLGTYLYVSEENADGTRYVGSSLYDVVTKIDASVFDFLNGSFNETFARKALVMTDIESVTDIKVSCHLDELQRDYEILYRETVSGTYGYFIKLSDTFTVDNTRLRAYAEANPQFTAVNLNNFYSQVGGMDYYQDANGTYSERAGKSYLREWIQALWATDYAGELEDGESAIAGKDELLSLSFVLEGGKEYTYRFYRVSDRQVAVRLEFPDKTPTQDFYISTLAFKKICNCYISLLNAEVVNGEVGYGD